MRRPSVSVIIPHYNDLPRLELCLAALQAQTYPPELIEIVVADNGSEASASAVEETIRSRAKLVVVTERGAGPARNGGVSASAGEILAFIDSDCVPAAEWIEQGVAALADFDFIGGKVEVSVADPRSVTPTEAFEKVFAFDFESYIESKGFTGSGNMFVRRQVFDHVGGFRGEVSEDVDWSRRARALGFRLGYEPGAVVSHPARREWAELREKWRRINRESFALCRATPGGRLRWIGRTLLLPASAVAHTPRILFSDKLRSPNERLGALALLWRSRFWRFGNSLKLAVRR